MTLKRLSLIPEGRVVPEKDSPTTSSHTFQISTSSGLNGRVPSVSRPEIISPNGVSSFRGFPMSCRRFLEFFVWAKHIALLHAPLATETGSYVANKRIYHMAPLRNCQLHKEAFLLPFLLAIHVGNFIV